MEYIFLRESKVEGAFSKFPVIEFDRFKLRKLMQQDYKDIIDIYRNDDLFLVDRIPEIYGEKSAKKFISLLKEKYIQHERLDWAIELKNEHKIVGLIGIYNVNIIDSKLEIGYIMNKDFMRQGIMSKCVSHVINYLIDELNIHRIEANIYVENKASIKLCQKLGFKREGLRKDYIFNIVTEKYMNSYIYSLVIEDQ